jgi:hypothetical protein
MNRTTCDNLSKMLSPRKGGLLRTIGLTKPLIRSVDPQEFSEALMPYFLE